MSRGGVRWGLEGGCEWREIGRMRGRLVVVGVVGLAILLSAVLVVVVVGSALRKVVVESIASTPAAQSPQHLRQASPN